LRKLTAVHIEAFEADLQRGGWVKARAKPKVREGEPLPCDEQRGLSAQTVKHIHRTLSQALKHAVRQGVLFKNPAADVQPPRPEEREIKILSKGEIGTILRAARGTPLYAPITVAVTTGLRRGELLGLRWSDIDLDAGLLTVNRALEQIGGTITFKAPKTKRSRRTITLPSITVEVLREHKAAQAQERLRMGLGRPELVFARPDGSPLDADRFTKNFGRLIQATKVTPITLHGLRHTHLSHLLMDGVHIKVVSERAGHTSVTTTLAKYSACSKMRLYE
jgi:integrase